jgi:hypothetical protein
MERLAAASGLSLTWIGFVERNPTALRPRSAEKIAQALGCHPRELQP